MIIFRFVGRGIFFLLVDSAFCDVLFSASWPFCEMPFFELEYNRLSNLLFTSAMDKLGSYGSLVHHYFYHVDEMRAAGHKELVQDRLGLTTCCPKPTTKSPGSPS